MARRAVGVAHDAAAGDRFGELRRRNGSGNGVAANGGSTNGAASAAADDDTARFVGKVIRGTDGRRRRMYFGAKRALDLLVVVALAPFVAPVVLVFGLLVKLDSRGPMFFGQPRIGAVRVKVDGQWQWELREFRFHKLRSMRADADTSLHRRYLDAYIAGDEEAMAELRPNRAEGSYKLDDDPRVTRVGRFIRRWSLDELPQLWNVFVGEMTLVGPRPVIPYELLQYREDDFVRLAGLPGITGWWQVNGRSTVDFQQMIDLDRYYLDRQSIRLDVEVLFRTLPVVMSRQGAG